ncbi:hypothetical protein OIE68_09310 [Nocardia vinacea]|uniref:hypothetical protein n=1 Tax=Nocardia vinacea TaxID=96468 RepID=UPI002E1311E4|nr:hypothetical protein OIE68_09310 [Nocardia vinacea]
MPPGPADAPTGVVGLFVSAELADGVEPGPLPGTGSTGVALATCGVAAGEVPAGVAGSLATGS